MPHYQQHNRPIIVNDGSLDPCTTQAHMLVCYTLLQIDIYVNFSCFMTM